VGRARKVTFSSLPVISQTSTPLLFTIDLQLLPTIMDVDAIDLDMGHDSLYGANSPSSSLAVQQWIDDSHDPANDFHQATPYDLLPDTSLTANELTPLSPAEQTAQQNQTPPATPRFDPAALLNPKSVAKRPASTSEGSESSRAEPTSAGQVSLVERLHNVQERAASPAKRVKTTEEQQRKKKPSNGASFGGGSALDLNQNGGAPLPPPAQVDLTMSKCSPLLALEPC
jgi:hypothetical protein